MSSRGAPPVCPNAALALCRLLDGRPAGHGRRIPVQNLLQDAGPGVSSDDEVSPARPIASARSLSV